MSLLSPISGSVAALSSSSLGQPALRLADEPRFQEQRGTLLFTDIVGYQEQTRDYSDRELMAYMARHRRIVRQVVEDFGGRLRNTFGDGIFVEFRQNGPHYDGHGERAIFAALNIFRSLAPEMPSHVGIHTGSYLEGNMEDGCHSQDLAGRDVIIASRCQTMKMDADNKQTDFTSFAGDRLIISAATHAALGSTQNRLDMQDLGAVVLKGLEDAIHLYAVLDEAPLKSEIHPRLPTDQSLDKAANA